MDIPTHESLYDYDEAAARLHVKRSWLEAAVQRGEVPHRRLGRLVRFTPDDLAEIIRDSRRAAQVSS